jgi:hypothetical protein
MVVVLGNVESEAGVMPSMEVLETLVDALSLRLLRRTAGALRRLSDTQLLHRHENTGRRHRGSYAPCVLAWLDRRE